MVINPAIWLAGWEHFCPYLRNKVFPKYVICGGTENIINKIIFIIEQIQKKLMTKFFIKLKNNFDWFSQFWGKNFFWTKSTTTSYRFLATCQNLEKTYDSALRKLLNKKTNRKMKGPFYILYFIEPFQLPLNPISLKLTLLWSSTRKCYSTWKLTQ